MRQKISQRQTVTVKTPCSHEPSSLWEILLGWDGSSWDRSLSMNIHVPSDRNLSTTASLAFGVGWIPTGLFLGTESPHRRSRIIGHLVDDEEDLPLVFDHNGIPLAWWSFSRVPPLRELRGDTVGDPIGIELGPSGSSASAEKVWEKEDRSCFLNKSLSYMAGTAYLCSVKIVSYLRPIVVWNIVNHWLLTRQLGKVQSPPSPLFGRETRWFSAGFCFYPTYSPFFSPLFCPKNATKSSLILFPSTISPIPITRFLVIMLCILARTAGCRPWRVGIMVDFFEKPPCEKDFSVILRRIGQNAGWKKRVVVQWVILQAENLMPDVSRLFQVAIYSYELVMAFWKFFYVGVNIM